MNKIISILLIITYSVNCYASKGKWDSDKSDWSKLMLATYKGSHNKMKRLISKRVDINYETKSGLTAIDVAVRKQDAMAVDILLNTGKIVANDSGELVMEACKYGEVEIVKKLISHKYSISNDARSNYSPLMAACAFGSIAIVDYLIKVGVNVNEQNLIDGMTPLMYSVNNGDIEKVRKLLSNGADKTIKDKNGKKAVDYLDTIPERMHVNEITKNGIRDVLR